MLGALALGAFLLWIARREWIAYRYRERLRLMEQRVVYLAHFGADDEAAVAFKILGGL
jgi:uncharacterized membrane protein